jgi:tRNA A37 threonylcarbamoyladenosine dehydratase
MPDASSGSTPPEREIARQFSRTVDLLGPEGFARLEQAFVLVAGLGGVGSHAALALARAGLGRLRLVDFDRVTETSLNRHAVALPRDVGELKTRVVRRQLELLNPALRVDDVEAFVDGDTAPGLLADRPDYVVDAIDSLTPKVLLLRACIERGVPVVSSMGASAHTDPTQVRVAPLEETQVCPLARQVRKRLRRLVQIRGVTAVFSLEPALSPLPPDDVDERLERGRVRNRLPSLSTLPGVFGYTLASVVIREVAGARR